MRVSPEEWALKISELIKEAEADGMAIRLDGHLDELVIFSSPGEDAHYSEWVDAHKSAIRIDW
jgi:hypothetical protein